MSVLPEYVSHYVCAWCPRRPEEGIMSSRTGVTDSCKPQYGCWESKSSPLEEQLVFLITGLFFQTFVYSFNQPTHIEHSFQVWQCHRFQRNRGKQDIPPRPCRAQNQTMLHWFALFFFFRLFSQQIVLHCFLIFSVIKVLFSHSCQIEDCYGHFASSTVESRFLITVRSLYNLVLFHGIRIVV